MRFLKDLAMGMAGPLCVLLYLAMIAAAVRAAFLIYP